MITGTTLIDRVRLELNDPIPVDDVPRWPTAELVVYANDAVRDYSKYFPRVARTELLATSTAGPDGGYEVALDRAVGRITRVGYQQQGRLDWIQERPQKPGDMVGGSSLGRFGRYRGGYAGAPAYELSGPAGSEDLAVSLRLNFAPANGTYLVVDYTTAHDLFDAAFLDVPTTIPDDDEELLALYTTAKAWARVSGQDAGLSRWDETGRRDDSPILPKERTLFRAYRYKLMDRLASGPRAYRLRRV
jgi:hypothetical protein